MSDMVEGWDHDLGGVLSGQALWEQPRYNEASGASDIEGKVARVSDERAGETNEFQIRIPQYLLPASHQEKFSITLRPHCACHYAETLE